MGVKRFKPVDKPDITEMKEPDSNEKKRVFTVDGKHLVTNESEIVHDRNLGFKPD
jgi:hypothetical protein